MEINKEVLHLAHHRSRQRVRDLGEVFTPDKYVQQMLDMLDKSVWADENKIFFEPTCGHGNFVAVVIQRRLNAFFKKAKRQQIKKPHFYAAANTLDNLWAIDIDFKNINFCRNRVWEIVLNFLVDNENRKISIFLLLKKNKEFFSHILCCIHRQIHENELLSCLEGTKELAIKSASQTKTSKKWLGENKHNPISFDLPWSVYFRNLDKQKIVPKEYSQQFKFLSSIYEKKPKGIGLVDFSLARVSFVNKTRKKVA